MNRQERRAQKKNRGGQPAYKRMTREQRMDALVKNGITIQDLEKNYNIGYDEGFKIGSEHAIRTIYASICLALHELHGFGRKRCYDVLALTEQKLLETLTSVEAIDEVWQKIGLNIDFNEPFDRITETEEDSNAKV